MGLKEMSRRSREGNFQDPRLDTENPSLNSKEISLSSSMFAPVTAKAGELVSFTSSRTPVNESLKETTDEGGDTVEKGETAKEEEVVTENITAQAASDKVNVYVSPLVKK